VPLTPTTCTDSPLDLVGSGERGQPAVLTFAAGLPGFPEAHRFSLEPLDPRLEPFCRMRSLDQPGLGFTVLPPGVLFDDYQVVVDEESVERLGLRAPDDAVVLAIVTLAIPPEPPKVNLLGPIVVNRSTGAAAQVVQHGSAYGVAVPLDGSGAPSATAG
jgi:flagellar assembly factor FliW